MPQLGKTARIRVEGQRGVTASSPLEDQVQEIYAAVSHYAKANGFESFVHHGPHGAVKGTKGPMILSRLVRQVIPDLTEDEFRVTYSLILQVLRKTDGAVCIRRPRDGDPEGTVPEWFVADKMPSNLVVVAIAYSRDSAKAAQGSPHTFDEERYLSRRERRVSAEEAGENLPPGEVTVSSRKGKDPVAGIRGDDGLWTETQRKAFEESRVRRTQDHHAFVQRVLEEVRTSAIPCSAVEITQAVNSDEGWKFSLSRYRDALRELVDGKQVVDRKETPDERRLRGGGSFPKGGSAALYWPAPGPVPPRDTLPPGVQPARAASDWSKDQVELWREEERRVLEYISQHRQPALSTVKESIPGMDPERVELAITRLIASKQLRKDSRGRLSPPRSRKNHSHQEPQPAPTPEPEQPADSEEKSLPSTTVTDTVPTTAPPPAGDRRLQLVQELADTLGVTLPQADQDELERLRSENEKLRRQVTALKAAIAAMEV